MDWQDVGDWFDWIFTAFVFVVTVLLALGSLAVAIYLVVTFVHRRTLAASLPDAPYQPLLPEDDDDDDERCAICVAPYEAGERCCVLPGCTHMFHKPCVATWLRMKNTCPLCRARVVVTGGGVPPQRQRRAAGVNALLNAVENMV